LFISTAFGVSVNAQENLLKDSVPPPLSFVSQGEGEQLKVQTDMKKRTELALNLMQSRLMKAETLSNEKKYRESLDELGGFQAIMSDAMVYLQRKNTGSGKVLSSFKRFEITLRSFVPRLESVRRLMPEKFGYHVVQLMKSVRKTRSTAVEPLFSQPTMNDN
jgi:DNA repair ATPase RecN